MTLAWHKGALRWTKEPKPFPFTWDWWAGDDQTTYAIWGGVGDQSHLEVSPENPAGYLLYVWPLPVEELMWFGMPADMREAGKRLHSYARLRDAKAGAAAFYSTDLYRQGGESPGLEG